MRTSESIKAIGAALLKVQAAVHGVAKNAQNPHFRNRYATLEAVIETVKPAMQANGLVFVQAPGDLNERGLNLTTRIIHPASGEWIETTLCIPLAKSDPQGAGSAITYGLRYSLMAMLGLPPVDDDAEAALGRPANGQATVDAGGYCDTAMQIIRVSKSEKDLRRWWEEQRPKRQELGLSQNSGQGQKLYNAFLDRMAELKAEVIAA